MITPNQFEAELLTGLHIAFALVFDCNVRVVHLMFCCHCIFVTAMVIFLCTIYYAF